MARSEKSKEVADLLDLGERSDQGLDSAIQAYNTVSTSQARWRVTRLVIGTYVLALLAIIVYLIIRSFLTGESEFDALIEIVKIAYLPVVTLVIGYYFGSSSNRA